MTRRGGTGPTLVVSALLAVAVLSGCSGGSGGSDASGGSGGPSASAAGRTPSTSATTAYPSGAPTGTVLTEPGTTVALGSDATVSWEPRQGQVGTVRIKVDRIERTTFVKSFRDWRVDATTKTYAPYFVHAHVTNLGTSDLGGAAVPLYGESAANALVEPAVFKETFKPCHPSVLPKPFPAGRSVPVCVVYLVPGRGQLVGAAFRPTQDFAPIVWKSAS
ncbi:hypothetical protein GCM10009798_31730 [Nocardioides panacihumi]|uniref:DUF4352 domain-containing protein n=1 Tax=Nocardioides panacihumi TaxID=400774 RepID=A0ABN2RGH3_9ACTN